MALKEVKKSECVIRYANNSDAESFEFAMLYCVLTQSFYFSLSSLSMVVSDYKLFPKLKNRRALMSLGSERTFFSEEANFLYIGKRYCFTNISR